MMFGTGFCHLNRIEIDSEGVAGFRDSPVLPQRWRKSTRERRLEQSHLRSALIQILMWGGGASGASQRLCAGPVRSPHQSVEA